jgi:hypothetical protein
MLPLDETNPRVSIGGMAEFRESYRRISARLRTGNHAGANLANRIFGGFPPFLHHATVLPVPNYRL